MDISEGGKNQWKKQNLKREKWYHGWPCISFIGFLLYHLFKQLMKNTYLWIYRHIFLSQEYFCALNNLEQSEDVLGHY